MFVSSDSLIEFKRLKSLKEEVEANSMGKCYGCALFTVEHCLTILRAFATIKESHETMLRQVSTFNFL